MISFFVPGLPIAQQRAKTIFKDGRVVGKYDPPKCKEFKATVKQVAQEACRSHVPWTGAVGMDLFFYLPRPKSASKKKRPFPITKPDIDNLYKGIADALEWIVYEKDQQVIRIYVQKFYADNGQQVGVEVRIRELKPQEEMG